MFRKFEMLKNVFVDRLLSSPLRFGAAGAAVHGSMELYTTKAIPTDSLRHGVKQCHVTSGKRPYSQNRNRVGSGEHRRH